MEYIKFFKSSGTVQTVILNTEDSVPFIDSGESEHSYSSADEAKEHSLANSFIVWDGEPIGLGTK